MPKLLIIYPHWHPANLAGVQRPRLIGNQLKALGWTPRVLTVEAKYFEEKPDLDFERTFSKDFEVTRVKAKKVRKPRLVGDLGLRAYRSLFKAALEIIKTEQIDFIWLPIPSFYNALLGSKLYDKTSIPYGIDYIDPWVRDISNQNNWRAKLSQWVARVLEPIAIKKVSVISGVSTPYYAPVIERNFPSIANQLLKINHNQLQQPKDQQLRAKNYELTTNTSLLNPNTGKPITHIGMPYGFDPNDHKIKLDNLKSPWSTHHKSNPDNYRGKIHTCKIWLYAGAFLPNSHVLMDAFFKAIKELRLEEQWDNSIQLWFIGTGQYPAKRITEYALDHQIDDIVYEQRDRFPFLQVLNFLSAADTVMIIGSTEEHYTASKTYQSLLSERPVVSIFHHKSSAVKVMEDCNADQFTVRYQPEMTFDEIVSTFKERLLKRLQGDEWQPDLSALDQYSAKESARKLVEAIERVI